VVSAASPIVAQELNLRSSSLLEAFANSPDGMHLLELRVVGRRFGSGGGRLGGDVD
jgi:hypothetical protein